MKRFSKIEAVNSVPRPKCASEVCSFLRLTTYSSRYVPDYSSVTYPHRQIDQDNKFLSLGNRTRWRLHKAQASPSKSTGIGTLQPHCTYPACGRRITLDVRSSIATAASRFHIRPIANGSRSLTEFEMKYAQLEKESLAIVFGCEHFNQYLYGRNFELETNPKVSDIRQHFSLARRSVCYTWLPKSSLTMHHTSPHTISTLP